jgi:hypothetical protein
MLILISLPCFGVPAVGSSTSGAYTRVQVAYRCRLRRGEHGEQLAALVGRDRRLESAPPSEQEVESPFPVVMRPA